MKLRSGKVVSTFPTKLDRELKKDLQNFKTLFSGNPEHAKELLDVISKAQSGVARVDIRRKIEEIYDNNELPSGNGYLMGAVGDLAWLLVGNPQYHDIIEERIKNFDLETPLLGSIEENNIEME